MKRSFNLFMLLLLCSTLFSTNYTFTGTADSEWTNPGNWDVYPGLSIQEGDIAFINSDCQITDEVQFYGDVIISETGTLSCCGFLDVWSNLTNHGSLFSDGYVALYESAVLTNEGTMSGFGYNLEGELINNGTLEDCSFDDIYGSITNNGTALFLHLFGMYGTFLNSSTGIIEDGDLWTEGEFVNEGTINNAWLENYNAMSNSGEMNNITYYSWYESSLTNTGILTADFIEINEGTGINSGTIDVAELFAIWEYTSFENTGTILTQHLDVLGLLTNSGEITVTTQVNNGYDDYPIDGLSHIVNDGTITNQGTFYNNDTIFNNLDLINEGLFMGSGVIIGNVIIEAGMSPGNSPGIFTVVGDYQQTATAELTIEIDDSPASGAGVGYDQVNVSGNTDLAGTLTVVTNYSSPSIGDTYPIFLYGSRTGSDFILNAPDPAPGLKWTIIYESDRILLIVDAAVPVELSSFKIEETAASITLHWTTETEVNNNGFEVMRSKDGLSWERLSYVSGVGNSLSQQKYSFEDRRPLNGVSYYKLKQVDHSGDYAYSHVLTTERTSRLNIYPNPAAEFINLETDKQSRFEILDQTGRVVQEGLADSSTRIDIASLVSGNYMLRFDGEVLQFTKR